MPRFPLEETVDPEGNSPSPFALLKEDTSPQENQSTWRRRTGSLDEFTREMDEGSDENHERDSSSVVTALHSSFDAALLEEEEHNESIFRSGKRHASNDLTSKEPEAVAPETVRKLKRRSHLPPGVAAKKTPGRHSHSMLPPGSAKASIEDRTPTSASRRRRSHSQRKSPMRQRKSPRHQGVARIPSAATPQTFKLQESVRETSPATPRVSLFGTVTQLKPPQILTPTRATPGYGQAAAAKSATKVQESCNTGPTVNSSYDVMNETESHDTSSPSSTPFRFSSFPASLPRVNNPRTTDRNYKCPPSTRKHMMFAAFAEGEDGEADEDDARGSLLPLHLSRNSSQDDDGTHNSSISSLSADVHREIAPPSILPKVLEWKSPEDASLHADGKHDEATEARLGVASSVHAKLFPDDEDMVESPGAGQVSRTRLDFNRMASPNQKHQRDKEEKINFGKEAGKKESQFDLSRPYEQQRSSSFPSTASSGTPLRNVSGFDEGTSGSGMTPSRPGVIDVPQGAHALSPREVEFHFHVDASQCSPIPGIPEEGGGGFERSDSAMDTDKAPPGPSSSSRLFNDRPPRSAPRKRPQRMPMSQAGAKTSNLLQDNDEVSRLSVSNESGDCGSSTSSKMRRLRPMPDMSAFDAGLSNRSPSTLRNDRSMDESSGAMDTRPVPPSPQLVCPPTPERTPAWAYSTHGTQHKYARSNSLIATKVLATCPAQVLDGHSSLENSLLDDEDDDSETGMFGRRPMSLSFSAVEEEMEGQCEEGSPIRDLSDLHGMFTAPPSTGIQPRLTRHASAPLSKFAPPPILVATTSCIPRVAGGDLFQSKNNVAKTPTPPQLVSRLSGTFSGVGSVISFSADFDNLGKLGSGTFADVYKVRSRSDQQLYAVKRNRRQFRGKRDREMAMAEVRIMQRLQSVCAQSGASSSGRKERTKDSYSLYLLFFFRAWQEDGYFFCQTELCCRDTCREMMDCFGSQWPVAQAKYPSLKRHFPRSPPGNHVESVGELVPENTVWKVCHDVAAGLSHIHSHGIVHNDIKPSNIFLVPHSRLGALLKIGDFGMAGDVGTSEDGQEGDTLYMAPELLSSAARHPSADIFSLGLTLYELASSPSWELPSEGSRWQELRNGSHSPDLPLSRSPELSQLIRAMINPDPQQRPTSDDILQRVEKVKESGNRCDDFLRDYIMDINEFDRVEEERRAMEQLEAEERGQTPRNAHGGKTAVREMVIQSPTAGIPFAPVLFTPEPANS